MDVELKDGTIIEGVPDGMTRAQLLAKLQAGGYNAPQDAPPQPIAAKPNGLARQLGLTARYGIEGLANLAQIGTEPIRAMVTDPLMRAVTGSNGRSQSLSEAATGFADRLGLPSPETPTERVVGDASRTLAGGGGLVAGARTAAMAVPGVAGAVFGQMAAQPVAQLAGAATAGASGGAMREAGGGPLAQFGASLAGGVAGGLGAGRIESAANAARNLLTPKTVQLQRADQQLQATLERSGVDWSQVPERIRQTMREDAAQALKNGQPLNAEALRRLLVFRSTGTTPRVGQLTQDPGQITREANLAKAGANSQDPALQRASSIENENISALLRQLDEAGAATAPDAMGAGRSAVSALKGSVDREQGNINKLYKAARDTEGRSLPLEGGTFTRKANQLLDEANVGSFLPTDIANKMNAIAQGKYPLTVDIAEQLKTSMASISRNSSDGNVRKALSVVRGALDDAPLQPGAEAGKESVAAFNAARSANSSFMQKVETNPALKAVVDDIEPDQFVQKFVVGKGATAADVKALRSELTPDAADALKGHLVRHLRDRATNSTDDITKFSNDAYRRALRDIGEDKLQAFFSAEELKKLKDVGEAAKYIQAQPAGTAINNSNSGALVISDLVNKTGNYVPFGLDRIITGAIQRRAQSQTLKPANALITAAPRRPSPLPANLLLLGGTANAREDDRRR